MNIGHQLRKLLEEKGIKQTELANALHLSASTLNGYIRNYRQPDANTVVRLAAYFNTTTDYLYGVTPLREDPTSPYNAEERRLIDIYRAIPDDKKLLFLETGKLFSSFEKNKSIGKHIRNSKSSG